MLSFAPTSNAPMIPLNLRGRASIKSFPTHGFVSATTENSMARYRTLSNQCTRCRFPQFPKKELRRQACCSCRTQSPATRDGCFAQGQNMGRSVCGRLAQKESMAARLGVYLKLNL